MDNPKEIEKLLSQNFKGVTQLEFIHKDIFIENKISKKNNTNEFFPNNDEKVSFQLTIGKDGKNGILVVSQNLSSFSKKQFWIRLLISGSLALLIVALIVYKKIRLITDPLMIMYHENI